ncbi:isovaleryl-CoA dehydrogenase [Isoalcanivorax beigongshangi]|uniref:Isovaleryl-CoA dehydrogenase n=1 Tax=Isoalcanivorax beigongshangi TaxID=3238810 RepID=A0ABV4AI81_9GAMM
MTTSRPGLRPDPLSATHEVFNQPSALEGHNLYQSDVAVQEMVARYGGGRDSADLVRYGALCGQPDIIELGFQANAFPPRFDTHDRFGHRSDQVHYQPAYHQLMKMALSEGLHSTPWTNPGAGAHVMRAAQYYLHSQVESGHCCPVTMTFAAVPTLQRTPAIAEAWLPKVLARDYDPRNVPDREKSALTIGMGMTEKQGGSDVRANTTRAWPIGSGGPGEAYELVGHKWFLSAPMCDAFLMLAQAEGGLSCFLVPRWRPDGSKNPLQVQRLKDKMGNVSNASSEVELRGALGYLVGEEGRGVPAIIEMVSMTRFDCMVGSAAAQRQAVLQALHHASQRAAFGRTLADQPLMQNVLADLQLELEGSLAISFRVAQALDQQDDPAQQLFARLGTAVGKYWICKRTPHHAYEAMEVIGGSGVMENCIMPRLYRDAPINAIWEGSGNVQALDVLRALAKTPAVLDNWLQELAARSGKDARLDRAVARLQDAFRDTADAEYRARHLVDQLSLTMQAALLVDHAPQAVAEAFIASRLGEGGDRQYGTLPRGIDVKAIMARGYQR